MSHSTEGTTTTGNARSANAVISADGNTIAFSTSSTDLVPGFVSNNGIHEDVFVSASGSISLVSRSHQSPTAGGNGRFFDSVVSADGSTIAFESTSTDLVADFVDNNPEPFDLDVYSFREGIVSLVSHGLAGPNHSGNANSRDPVLSANGRVIAFNSGATDLVTATKHDGSGDIFTSVDGVLSLISHREGDPDHAGNDFSSSPLLSADGRVVIFLSWGRMGSLGLNGK